MRKGPCSRCSNSAAQGIEEASRQSTDSARHSETIHNDNIICVKSGDRGHKSLKFPKEKWCNSDRGWPSEFYALPLDIRRRAGVENGL